MERIFLNEVLLPKLLYHTLIVYGTRYIAVNGKDSNERRLTFGIPQGSVLGPLLFNLYMNGLFGLSSGGEIIGLANDTVVLYRDKTMEDLRQKATDEFEKTIFSFFSSNKLFQPTFGDLQINEKLHIPQTKSTKYLGIVIDEHLKWHMHVTYLARKLRGIQKEHKVLEINGIMNENSKKKKQRFCTYIASRIHLDFNRKMIVCKFSIWILLE